jgi:hypothetical protein
MNYGLVNKQEVDCAAPSVFSTQTFPACRFHHAEKSVMFPHALFDIG